MKSNRNYFEFSQKMERIMNKYNNTKNDKNDYNTGIDLTRSEIHTIEVIGLNSNINITQLAKIKGVTKGAASKMIYKLCDKGLVAKNTSPNSDSEVNITLTDKGQTAYEQHKKIHDKINKKLFDNLDEFSDAEYKKIIKLINDLEDMIDCGFKY